MNSIGAYPQPNGFFGAYMNPEQYVWQTTIIPSPYPIYAEGERPGVATNIPASLYGDAHPLFGVRQLAQKQLNEKIQKILEDEKIVAAFKKAMSDKKENLDRAFRTVGTGPEEEENPDLNDPAEVARIFLDAELSKKLEGSVDALTKRLKNDNLDLLTNNPHANNIAKGLMKDLVNKSVEHAEEKRSKSDVRNFVKDIMGRAIAKGNTEDKAAKVIQDAFRKNARNRNREQLRSIVGAQFPDSVRGALALPAPKRPNDNGALALPAYPNPPLRDSPVAQRTRAQRKEQREAIAKKNLFGK